MSVHLRDYQQDAVEAVRNAYRGGAQAPLLVIPTGGGKTVIFSHVSAGAAARGINVLILVHRRELIRQASAKLREAGVEHGIIAPGHTPTRDTCQVASVQTLLLRIKAGRFTWVPGLIVVDEAHHAVAGQWAKVLAQYPQARVLGVTATPERMDARGLGKQAGGPFDAMVLGPNVADLMRRGFLVPAKVYAPADGPDLSGVKTVAGDYATGSLAAAMEKPGITGDAVSHYARLARGRPGVAFCVSVRHSDEVAEAFRSGGFRAVSVSGSTPAAERDAAISGLATGKVEVLCTCDLISEGLDVPSIGAAIMLRPTQSLGLYLQQIGRGLRTAEGKDHLVVLDHAGNVLRHGMPDAERDWSLAGKTKRDRTASPVRQCPSCYIIDVPRAVCQGCGHQFKVADPDAASGRKVEVTEGTLRELSTEDVERLRRRPLKELLAEATGKADVEAIRKARGYKRGWTKHVLREQADAAVSA